MIKRNKVSIILLFILFCALVYCHFNTMILNDDLPYSLYFRANNRVTDVIGIIKNQVFDYSHINARIFLHSIVQFLLMFDKNLWSIVNPLVIVISISLMAYFVKEITKIEIKNFYLTILCIIGYLLLYKFKFLIYWVAGSVNYVWIFLILIGISIYYYKFGLLKYKKITGFMCLVISMLCEVSAIFMIGLVLTDFIIKVTKKEINKKIIITYIIYLVLAIGGFLFILLAPSTMNRMDGDNEWQKLSLLSKLLITLPVISSNLFNINIYNLYPVIYFLSLIYYFVRKSYKKGIIFIIVISIVYSMCYLIGGFFWLFLSLLLFVIQVYIFIKEKDYKLISLLVSMYLISYSLCITNEYLYGRVNFHFMLFNYIFSLYNYFIIGKYHISIKIFSIISMSVLIIFEVYIYHYIGTVKSDRDISIKLVQNGKTNVLETKIIKAPFDRFHIDANSPVDKNYWAYKAFQDYYKLPDDIEIRKKK